MKNTRQLKFIVITVALLGLLCSSLFALSLTKGAEASRSHRTTTANEYGSARNSLVAKNAVSSAQSTRMYAQNVQVTESTKTSTFASTLAPAATPTDTPTPTATPTDTPTPTATPTDTPTPTATPTDTPTPTATPTDTPTPTATPTATPTPEVTPTPLPEPTPLLSPNGPTMVYCSYRASAGAKQEWHMWIAYRTNDHRVHLAVRMPVRNGILSKDYALNILTTNTMSLSCAGDALLMAWSAEDGSARLFFGRFNTTPITHCDANTKICNLDEKGPVTIGTLQATSPNSPGLVGYWPSQHWSDATPWISWRGSNSQLYFAKYSWSAHNWSQKTNFALSLSNGPSLRPLITNHSLKGYTVVWPGTETPSYKVHVDIFHPENSSLDHYNAISFTTPTRLSIATVQIGNTGDYESSFVLEWRGYNNQLYQAYIWLNTSTGYLQWSNSWYIVWVDSTTGARTPILTKAPPAIETVKQYVFVGTDPIGTDHYFSFQDATDTPAGQNPTEINYSCIADSTGNTSGCNNW